MADKSNTDTPKGRWGKLGPADLDIGSLKKISNPEGKVQPWKAWKEKALSMVDDDGTRPWSSWSFDSENPRHEPWAQWMKVEWIHAGGMPGSAPGQNHQGG